MVLLALDRWNFFEIFTLEKMKDQEEEARTRITWGVEAEEVIQFLVDGGAEREGAQRVVAILQEKRNVVIVRRGYRRILTGGIVCFVSAVSLGVMWTYGSPAEILHPNRILGGSQATLAMGFFWGIWRLMDGVRDACRPERVREDLSL